jgi:hypothetical protein
MARRPFSVSQEDIMPIAAMSIHGIVSRRSKLMRAAKEVCRQELANKVRTFGSF